MGKRDIPEINAGSMADIAFLLLLFFLVTTTMEKDKAYIRNIPKKIDVPPDDVEIQKRNILAIKANSQNQLMVRNVVFSDPDKISDFILKFYQTSEVESGDSPEHADCRAFPAFHGVRKQNRGGTLQRDLGHRAAKYRTRRCYR